MVVGRLGQIQFGEDGRDPLRDGGLGAVLGLGIALVALLGIRSGPSSQLGADVSLNLPWSTMALTIGLCLLLALVSSVLPARMALRRTGAMRETLPRRGRSKRSAG